MNKRGISHQMLRSRYLLLLVAGILLLPASVRAQNARVITADSKRILDVTFDPPGVTQLNTDDALLGEPVSVAFRDDGANGLHLFAADRQKGKVLFYTNSAGAGAVVLDRAITGNPLRPDALSLD